MDNSRVVEVVLRGGPAHNLVMSIMRHQLYVPLQSQGWPHAYHWHLEEDRDEQGRPIMRCDVPDLIQHHVVISSRAVTMCSFDMIQYTEEQIRQRFLTLPGEVVHVHWEATNHEHEIERIDPYTADLSGYTMLKCGGMVIRNRYASGPDEGQEAAC